MANRVWQVDPALLGPLSFDDVQVGAAHPGRIDAHQNIHGRGDLWLGDLIKCGLFTIGMDSYGTHHCSPPWRHCHRLFDCSDDTPQPRVCLGSRTSGAALTFAALTTGH